jgi:hypothetical protein
LISLFRRKRLKIEDISDKEYMDIVARLGCVACLIDGNPGTPAELHHPREKAGMSERAPDRDVIGLCASHHRHGDTVPSIHKHQDMFRRFYGGTYELVARTRQMAEDELNSVIGRRA